MKSCSTSKVDVSVIIPAHNAEMTLKRAVESTNAFFQKLAYEVWVIENGSTDKTFQLAKTLENGNDFLHVTTSKSGVSNARNKGLQCCSGKWVMFLDADDYFNDQVGNIINAEIRNTTSDLILYGHCIGEKENAVVNHTESEFFEGKQNVELARAQMLKNPTRYMQVWAKLFKKSIIEDHQLWFDPELSFAEDSDFTYRYSFYCNGITFSKYAIYCYTLNSNSVMRKQDDSKTQNYILAMEKIVNAGKSETQVIRHAIDFYVLMHLNILMVRDIFAVNSAFDKRDKNRMMKNIIAYPVFANALNSVKINECRFLKMIPILALKLHLYAFAKLMFKIRAKQNYNHERKS